MIDARVIALANNQCQELAGNSPATLHVCRKPIAFRMTTESCGPEYCCEQHAANLLRWPWWKAEPFKVEER